jgi:RNA polymerase sporulation-specific sigma factor
MNSTLSREELIENNIGLVHSCAGKLKGRGIEYDDLFQAGCMGLCKAADAFDFNRGVRFSTYAVPVILGEMRRLFRDGGTVKVSRTLKELSIKVNRTRERFSLAQGREPTISEIAAELGVSMNQVAEAVTAATPPLSLTASEDDGGGQLDLPVSSPEDSLSDLLSLKQVLGQLGAEDRKLVYLRYFNNMTQTQTAQRLGMTQVQVSRREKKILTGLRALLIK